MELVWENPPRKIKAGMSWLERLEPVMARPGEWARVHVYDSVASAYTASSKLGSGDLVSPAGRWQFRASKIEAGGAVYARYLGASDDRN